MEKLDIELLIEKIASKGIYVDYYTDKNPDFNYTDITKFMDNQFNCEAIELALKDNCFKHIIYKFGNINIVDNSLDLELLKRISTELNIKIKISKESNLKLPYNMENDLFIHRELTQMDDLKRVLGFVSSKARKNLVFNAPVKGRLQTLPSKEVKKESYYLHDGKSFNEVQNGNEDYTVIVREFVDGSMAVYRHLYFGNEILFDGDYDLGMLHVSSVIILSTLYKKFDVLINYELKKERIEKYLKSCLNDLNVRLNYLNGLGFDIIEYLIRFNNESFTDLRKKKIPPVDWVERTLYTIRDKTDKFELIDLLKLTTVDSSEIENSVL